MKKLTIHTTFFISIFTGSLIFIFVLILSALYPGNLIIQKISSPELLIASAIAFPTIITWYFSIKSNTEQNLLETVKHYDQEINDLIKEVQGKDLTVVHISKMEYLMNSFENITKNNYKKESISLNYEGLLSVVYAVKPIIDFSELERGLLIENTIQAENDNEWIGSSSKITPRIITKLCENDRLESLKDNYYKVFARSKFDIVNGKKSKKKDVYENIDFKNKDFWKCEFSTDFINNIEITNCNFYSCTINIKKQDDRIVNNNQGSKEKKNKSHSKEIDLVELDEYLMTYFKNQDDSFEIKVEDIKKAIRGGKEDKKIGTMIEDLKENMMNINKFIIMNTCWEQITFTNDSFSLTLSGSQIFKNLMKEETGSGETESSETVRSDSEINNIENNKKGTILYDNRSNLLIKDYVYKIEDIAISNEKSLRDQKIDIIEALSKNDIAKDNSIIKISRVYDVDGFNWMGFHSITWKPSQNIDKIDFFVFAIRIDNNVKCLIFKKDKFKELMEEKKKGEKESQVSFKFYFSEKRLFD